MDVLSADELTYLAILGLLLLGYFTYSYLTTPYDYWTKQGVTSVPSTWAIIAVLAIMRKPLHELQVDAYKKYGRLYGAFEGKKPTLTVGEPELLRQIFVKDFQFFSNRRSIQVGDPISDNFLSVLQGEKWKRIRSIISPTFSTGKIKRMTDIILRSAKSVTQTFAKKAGQPVDSSILFGNYTMDVIASTAFATMLDSHKDQDNIFVQQAQLIFTQKFSWRIILYILFPKIAKVFGIPIFSAAPMRFFKKLTLDIIEERRRSGKVGNDFLQLLMDAEKEAREQKKAAEDENNDQDFGNEENGHIPNIPSKNRYMSLDELIAQCVIFFAAGYHTTAATLSFSIHLLALNQDVQNKLSKEVEDTIRNNGGKLTYDVVQEMKYLDNVISETLRMYPVASAIDRKADADYKLGDNGIKIKKDMIVNIPIYAIHHDPEFYPEPEKFRPERFSPTEKHLLRPYTFLPFGAGPRNCVGMRFALMEIKLCLAYMISQLKIKPCPKTKKLDITSQVGLLQAKDVFISVEIKENRVFDGL